MNDTADCWFNYRTGEYDWLDFMPDDLSDYVPQTFQMQEFYQHRIALGDTPLVAAATIRKLITKFELDE